MAKISMIGLDLAKNVFQVHGIDAEGKVVLRRQLRRGQMEKFFGQLPPTLCDFRFAAAAKARPDHLREPGFAVQWARLVELGLKSNGE